MYGNAQEVETTAKATCDVPRPTLTERLKNERHSLAARLAELDAAITALESNPQVQSILDLVQKVARY